MHKPSENYDTDFALLDRYQAFSAEILRLSLAGFAAVGLFLNINAKDAAGGAIAKAVLYGLGSRIFLVTTLILLALSAAAALAHRYFSSDSMQELIETDRDERSGLPAHREQMYLQFSRSTWAIYLAPVFLAAAVFTFGISIIAVLAMV